VQDERSIDKFHANDDRLYQVMEKSKENGIIRIQDGTQGLYLKQWKKIFLKWKTQ
jgi:hypothetical protein